MVSRLRFQRERRGWSRASLAQMLGTTSAKVAQWESGIAVPSPQMRESLCTLFGLPEQDILGEFPLNHASAGQEENLAFLLLPHRLPELPPGESSFVLDPLLAPPFKNKNELIGRDTLFAHLKLQLLVYHKLSLSGLPGIGKTALAIALAYDPEIRAEFYDGVLWAGLGVAPQIPGLYRRWGKLLGVPLRGRESKSQRASWKEALRAAVTQRHLLFILDDAWQVDTIDALQIGGPCCGYVLTTRIAHVARYLTGEQAVQIPELGEAESIQLLTRFVPEILHYERENARTLVHAVGGHPLALTLMSRYLGSNAAMGQPRRLRTALKSLLDAEQRLRLYMPQQSSEQTALDMEVSVSSAVAVSYRQLPEKARQALCALAVVPVKPVRLSQEAILAVTDVSLDVIDQLCDAELLERYRDVQYMLHPLIADYIRAQGPTPEAAQRLIAYGLHFLESHASDAAMLEQESSLLLAALDCAWEAEQWDDLLRGYNLFIPCLFRWGWYTLAEQLLQRASVAVIQNGSLYYRICLLEHLGTLAHLQEKYTLAQNFALQGLPLARQVRDNEKIIALLTLLGGSAHELSDDEHADAYYQEALRLARQHGDRQQISSLLKNLGVVTRKRGNAVLAQIYYQESLTLAKQLDDSDLVSLLLMNMGMIATERKNYALAQSYYDEGLTYARRAGLYERTAILLSNLGVLADMQRNYEQAEAFMKESLSIERQQSQPERMSLLLLNLGEVAHHLGKSSEAEAYYQEGLKLARQLEIYERVGLFLLGLGDLAMEQGQLEQAKSVYQEGLDLARRSEQRKRICTFLLHLGLLAQHQRAFDEAEMYLQEGLDLARQDEYLSLVYRYLQIWGELQLQRQRIDAAEQAFLEMLHLLPAEERAMIAHAQYGLAMVAAKKLQFQRARALAQSSYATFKELGSRDAPVVRAFLERLSLGEE